MCTSKDIDRLKTSKQLLVFFEIILTNDKYHNSI